MMAAPLRLDRRFLEGMSRGILYKNVGPSRTPDDAGRVGRYPFLCRLSLAASGLLHIYEAAVVQERRVTLRPGAPTDATINGAGAARCAGMCLP